MPSISLLNAPLPTLKGDEPLMEALFTGNGFFAN